MLVIGPTYHFYLLPMKAICAAMDRTIDINLYHLLSFLCFTTPDSYTCWKLLSNLHICNWFPIDVNIYRLKTKRWNLVGYMSKLYNICVSRQKGILYHRKKRSYLKWTQPLTNKFLTWHIKIPTISILWSKSP